MNIFRLIVDIYNCCMNVPNNSSNNNNNVILTTSHIILFLNQGRTSYLRFITIYANGNAFERK